MYHSALRNMNSKVVFHILGPTWIFVLQALLAACCYWLIYCFPLKGNGSKYRNKQKILKMMIFIVLSNYLETHFRHFFVECFVFFRDFSVPTKFETEALMRMTPNL